MCWQWPNNASIQVDARWRLGHNTYFILLRSTVGGEPAPRTASQQKRESIRLSLTPETPCRKLFFSIAKYGLIHQPDKENEFKETRKFPGPSRSRSNPSKDKDTWIHAVGSMSVHMHATPHRSEAKKRERKKKKSRSINTPG